MKIISRNEAKTLGLKRYFTGVPCNHDHLSERSVANGICFECRQVFRDSNKDIISIRRSDYYQKNKDKEKLRVDAWSANNKDKLNKLKRKYDKSNPLVTLCRSTLTRIMILKGGTVRESALSTLLGYDQRQFTNHIESLFVDGMCWDNHGEWHIDHIKPIKAFVDEGVDDIKIINALPNLQPLWAKDNISKGAKYNGE